jgi:hypothetical protein
MHFTDETVYATVKRETEGDFDIVVLPERSTLYRTSTRGVPTDSTSPVFLGDWAMVKSFYGNTGAESRTLFQYTTTKPAKLMIMTLASLKALAAGDETGFVQRSYLDYRDKLPPSVFERIQSPLGVLGAKPDTPIIVPAETTGTGPEGYANRDLAKLVCARGFEGWIVVPNSVVEYDPPGQRRRQAAVYSPEVVLCPGAGGPLEIVNYGKLTGGRRRRAKTGRRARARTTRRGHRGRF